MRCMNDEGVLHFVCSRVPTRRAKLCDWDICIDCGQQALPPAEGAVACTAASTTTNAATAFPSASGSAVGGTAVGGAAAETAPSGDNAAVDALRARIAAIGNTIQARRARGSSADAFPHLAL